jgi:2-polyprenyl-6-methoxyphenol hydroxylase-like FAD-dependent oxidoreductase
MTHLGEGPRHTASTAAGPDVLVVGGGPVGMLVACELLAQGASVRVIDRSPPVAAGDPHSRAILVLPRTLELLRRTDVARRLVDAGNQVPGIRYYSQGRLLGTARMDRLPDTPYPFVLALPQRETERALSSRLHDLGGTVEREVVLEDLALDDQLARVTLRHRDGSAEELTPGWVIGADGAASTTRRLLGLELAGDPTDVTYVIADAPVSGPTTADAQYFYARDGLLALVPMRDGLHRIAANVAHAQPGEEPAWRELLQGAVDRRARQPLVVGEPRYARLVRPRCGVAERFRRGRCFLIGDAAHVITPAGGQGMNLGFQDAVNLAWKLGGVLRGELSEEILDSYERERAAAAARTAATTARIVRLSQQRAPAKALLRDAGFVAADRAGLVQRVLAPLLSQLDVDYGEGRGRVRAGRRVPLFAADGSRTLDRDRYTVVLSPGRRVPRDWAATRDALRRRLGEHVALLDLAALPKSAPLRRGFGSRAVIAAVRPDGHVGHAADVTRPEAIVQFLRDAAPTRRREPATVQS